MYDDHTKPRTMDRLADPIRFAVYEHLFTNDKTLLLTAVAEISDLLLEARDAVQEGRTTLTFHGMIDLHAALVLEMVSQNLREYRPRFDPNDLAEELMVLWLNEALRLAEIQTWVEFNWDRGGFVIHG